MEHVSPSLNTTKYVKCINKYVNDINVSCAIAHVNPNYSDVVFLTNGLVTDTINHFIMKHVNISLAIIIFEMFGNYHHDVQNRLQLFWSLKKLLLWLDVRSC